MPLLGVTRHEQGNGVESGTGLYIDDIDVDRYGYNHLRASSSFARVILESIIRMKPSITSVESNT